MKRDLTDEQIEEVLEMLDNVTASLETMLVWYGPMTPAADLESRTSLANRSRKLVDSFLGGQ